MYFITGANLRNNSISYCGTFCSPKIICPIERTNRRKKKRATILLIFFLIFSLKIFSLFTVKYVTLFLKKNLEVTFNLGLQAVVGVFWVVFFYTPTSKPSGDFTIKQSVCYSTPKTPLCLQPVKQNWYYGLEPNPIGN